MAQRLETIAMDTILKHLPYQLHRMPNSIMKNMLIHVFTLMFTEMGERAQEQALSLVLHPDAGSELFEILAAFRSITSITRVTTEVEILSQEDEDKDSKQENEDAAIGLIWSVSDFKEVLDARNFQDILDFLEYLVNMFIDDSFILPKNTNGPADVDYQQLILEHAVIDYI